MNVKEKKTPGRYQELDLFIKVLRLLCPNLTDAPTFVLSDPIKVGSKQRLRSCKRSHHKKFTKDRETVSG